MSSPQDKVSWLIYDRKTGEILGAGAGPRHAMDIQGNDERDIVETEKLLSNYEGWIYDLDSQRLMFSQDVVDAAVAHRALDVEGARLIFVQQRADLQAIVDGGGPPDSKTIARILLER